MTADCVVFAQVKDQVKVLLIERGDEPCKGMWAIPGGFMNMDETAEEAAVRELKEETGIELTKVEQIGAFSKVDRDPRGRVITVAFYAVIGKAVKAVGQDDARRAKWCLPLPSTMQRFWPPPSVWHSRPKRPMPMCSITKFLAIPNNEYGIQDKD